MPQRKPSIAFSEELPSIPLQKLSKKVTEAIRFIYKNSANPHLSSWEISEHVGMEEDSFHKLFRTEMKNTPMKFLILVRILKSKSFLQNTKLSLYKVAFQSGFRSYDSFRMQFQRQVGIKPLEFRRRSNYGKVLETKVRMKYG